MNKPKICALGITQDGFTTRGEATGEVEGVGRLESWGKTLLEAMEALQARATRRVAEKRQQEEDA
jgi:hypothetical protein